MQLTDDQTAALKEYVSGELASISEADPMVLGDYVMALLAHDKDDEVLFDFCIEQLEDFLSDQTHEFLSRLFRHMSSVGYISASPAWAFPEEPLKDGSVSSAHVGSGASMDQPLDDRVTSSNSCLAQQNQSDRTKDSEEPQQSADPLYQSHTQLSQARYENEDPRKRAQPPSPTAAGDGRIKRLKVERGRTINGSDPSSDRRKSHIREKPTVRAGMPEKPKGIRRPPPGGVGVAGGDARRPPPRDMEEYDPVIMEEMGPQFIEHGPDRRMMIRPGVMPRPFMPEGYDHGRYMPKHYMGGPMMPPFVGDQGMLDPMQFPPEGRMVPYSMEGGPVRGGMPGRGTGRGRGSWRPPLESGMSLPSGRNGSNSVTSDHQTTLMVENIPADKCQLDAVNEYFKRFGTIVNIQINAKHQRAVVEFSNHQEALKAFSSPEAVFENRFVKIGWHQSSQPQQQQADGGIHLVHGVGGSAVMPRMHHPGMHHPGPPPPSHGEPFFPGAPPTRGFGGPMTMRGIRGRGSVGRSHAVPIRPPPPGMTAKGTSTSQATASASDATTAPAATGTTSSTLKVAGSAEKAREADKASQRTNSTLTKGPSTSQQSKSYTGGLLSAPVPSASSSTSASAGPSASGVAKKHVDPNSKRQLLHLQMEQQNLLSSQISKQREYMSKVEGMKRKLAEGDMSQEQFDKDKKVLMKGITMLQQMIEKTRMSGVSLGQSSSNTTVGVGELPEKQNGTAQDGPSPNLTATTTITAGSPAHTASTAATAITTSVSTNSKAHVSPAKDLQSVETTI